MAVAVEKTDPATGKTEHRLDYYQAPDDGPICWPHSGNRRPERILRFPARSWRTPPPKPEFGMSICFTAGRTRPHTDATRRGGFLSALAALCARQSAGRSLGIWLERRRPFGRVVEVAPASRSTNPPEPQSLRRCIWSTPASTLPQAKLGRSVDARCRKRPRIMGRRQAANSPRGGLVPIRGPIISAYASASE